MSKLLNIEENDSNKPILCIFGEESHILEPFVSENSTKFRIILVSAKRFDFLDEYPDIYFLTYKNAELLPKLQEKLDYVLIFLKADHTSEQLLPLAEKLTNDHSQTLVVVRPEELHSLQLMVQRLKDIPTTRFSLLGEILTVKRKNEGVLSKNIENAILNGEIRLQGNESFSVFGITEKDALYGISRLLFGNFKRDSMHLLFYKHPETILESAHLIARVEPDVKVLFSDSKEQSQITTREQLSTVIAGVLNLDESYVESLEGFEKGIEHLFAKKEEIAENVLVRLKKKKVKKKRRSHLHKSLKFALLSFLVGSFLFVFLNLLFFGFGMLFLQQALKGIQSNNFESVEKNARMSNLFLEIIKPTVELSLDAAAAIDSQGKGLQTYQLLEKAVELSEITGDTVFNVLKGGPLTKGSLESSLASFSFLYQEGQRVVGKTDNKTLAGELKNTYSNLLSLSQVLPIVLGFDSEKNYLLLFQNDEELRPTGGFIGSIGNLTVKNGKAEKFTIQDVYELDGQLRNHIEPPFVVRRYLQPHLYLRDSNFGLDFQESASKSAFIYNLETGNKPDAVIAVDLQVLRELLKISGPISLPSYNQTITSENVSSFIQSTVKDNFFPGSTQKRDILNSVFTQLIERVESDQKFHVSLFKILPELLENKNILLSFSDSSIQKVFSANNYAGSINDSRANNPKTINDFLYVNEANIGANKVNTQVKRKLQYKAIIGQGSLTSEASLTLSNSSPSDDYKVYINVVVPQASILKEVTIDGKKQTVVSAITDPGVYEGKDFVAPIGLETEQYQTGSLTYFSFMTTVKKNSQSTVTITYQNGITKQLSSITNYSLLVIKQPGTKPYNITTSFTYPEDFSPIDSTADNYGNNFLEKNGLIDKDYLMEFRLQKKQ